MVDSKGALRRLGWFGSIKKLLLMLGEDVGVDDMDDWMIPISSNSTLLDVFLHVVWIQRCSLGIRNVWRSVQMERTSSRRSG